MGNQKSVYVNNRQFEIDHTKGVNTKALGRSIDFYRANGGNVRENMTSNKSTMVRLQGRCETIANYVWH